MLQIAVEYLCIKCVYGFSFGGKKYFNFSVVFYLLYSCWFNRLIFILETILNKTRMKTFLSAFSSGISITVLVMPCALEKKYRWVWCPVLVTSLGITTSPEEGS